MPKKEKKRADGLVEKTVTDPRTGKRIHFYGHSEAEAMKKILDEIQTGEFAREFILENQAGQPVLQAQRRIAAGHLIEQVGSKLRGMMSWLKK